MHMITGSRFSALREIFQSRAFSPRVDSHSATFNSPQRAQRTQRRLARLARNRRSPHGSPRPAASPVRISLREFALGSGSTGRGGPVAPAVCARKSARAAQKLRVSSTELARSSRTQAKLSRSKPRSGGRMQPTARPQQNLWLASTDTVSDPPCSQCSLWCTRSPVIAA